MVAPVNDIDVHLQAESPRTLAARGGIILSTTTNVVTVDGSGNPSDSVITLVASPLVVAGSVAWATNPTVPLTFDSTGLIATMQYSAMGTSSVVVTVTLTSGDATYTDKQTIKQIAIGSLGYTGALNATANSTTQGALANRPTGSDGDFYFATDTLTLYQKIGGSWVAAGNNFTNTNQLVDGAGLGATAQWSGVSNIPNNLAGLNGNEGIVNSAITVNADGTLSGAGAGQVTNLPVIDTRNANDPPSSYGKCHIKELKYQTVIGIPGAAANTYCVLETLKGWGDASGGNALQWAYIDSGTVYKRSAPNDATSWGVWVRDLDTDVYTGDLNATAGATLGTNVGGQITSGNASTLIAPQAIGSVQISDLRTSNYAEDSGGNPTAGAKLASQGTALKVANNSFQVGNLILSDYWFRLIQGVDGNIANGRVIWRGNNDATTRGGAPNIACLSVAPQPSFVLTPSSGPSVQFDTHSYTLTPTTYASNSDNLDAMQQIHVQYFANTTDTAPFAQFYFPIPSRVYDAAAGTANGSWNAYWRATGNVPEGGGPYTVSSTPGDVLYGRFLRIRIGNTYGWSATQDFDAPQPDSSSQYFAGTPLGYTTITGIAGTSASGSGSQGGACPAPWVKVTLINGREVEASSLHNGARLAAVNDSTMQALSQGGIVRDLQTIWAQRYRVKLTDGTATEWSENHRFAVADRGWVQVQNLRGGDHILGTKEAVVDSVLAVGEGQVVSFRVEGAGTYFAGGLLCHNTKTIS